MVEAAICDLAIAVSEGENSRSKLMLPAVAVLQSGTPPMLVETVSPVQNIIDSGIMPVSTIWVAVLAVTTPASIGEPVALVAAKLEIRTKNEVLVAEGLVTLNN